MNAGAASSMNGSPGGTRLFLAAQLVLLPTLAVSAYWSQQAGSARQPQSLPELNNQPLVVRPLWNHESIVTDEQLQHVLGLMRFPAARPQPKINHVDHALRMWGRSANFAGDFLSGDQMVAMLTNDEDYRDRWGKSARPLIVQSPQGLRYRTQEGAASSSHVDHTLATFAEIGLPLDFEIRCRRETADLRTLVEQALRRFSLNQREYEWTALLLALYAPQTQAWQTQEGQEITFDRLAERIMRQEYGQGICYGGHRLFTLVILRRIDLEQQALFSDRVRQTVDEHLLVATRQLIKSQSPDGYWDRTWPGHPIKEINELWPLGSRFLATSHAMEWWAMAPEYLLPPRETLVRAGQWMVRELEKMDAETVQKNYTFLTHAGRALALWRGGFPSELHLDDPVPTNKLSN